MSNIMIESHDLWDYYQEHKDELSASMHEVANHFDYGIKIYITGDESKPQIVVEADDEEVYREDIASEWDCRNTAERIYNDYLTAKAMEMLGLEEKDIEDSEEDDINEQIEEREIELDDAVYQFLTDVLGGAPYIVGDDLDEMLDDLKEHFLEYMARKWGLDIYRPMILEDEDGEDFFEEYPYECMVFEDEDNPVYQRESHD